MHTIECARTAVALVGIGRSWQSAVFSCEVLEWFKPDIITEERRAAQFLSPLVGIRIAVKVANLSDEPHSRQLDTNHTNKHFIKAVIWLFQVPGFRGGSGKMRRCGARRCWSFFSYLKKDGENGLRRCVQGQRTPDNFPCVFSFVRFLSTWMCCRFYSKCHDYYYWTLC